MFTSAWIPGETLERMTGLVRDRSHLDGAIIEFGSWEGRSTIAIALGTEEPVLAVDHWRGNPGDEHTEPYAAAEDIYARFLRNTQDYPNIIPVRRPIEEFMSGYSEPIKFLHIDADHNYGPVRDQIEWARPLMVGGGIMCGDDYASTWPGVVQAVNECLPSHHVERVMWMQEF
ncbi:MAG TPA: class I SAM-dependent methyltransferase [Acidimicrobiia bacterium]